MIPKMAHRIDGVGDDAEGVGRIGQVIAARRVAHVVGRQQDLATGEVAHACTETMHTAIIHRVGGANYQ